MRWPGSALLIVRPEPFGGEVLVVHPWVAFLCAVALSAALAFALGIPVLKLKGHYLAMATLGVGTIIFSVALGTSWLGAADGISGVPAFPLLPGVAVGGSAAARVANYYVAFGLLAVGMLLLLNLVQSRIGRALRAIHGAEDAAERHGRGHRGPEAPDLRPLRRPRRRRRRVPHPPERRDRALRGLDHEVGQVRRRSSRSAGWAASGVRSRRASP